MSARRGSSASAHAHGERSVAIQGEVVDSVIVTGDNVSVKLELGSEHGALLELLRRSAAPSKRPRALPLAGRPPPFHDLLDREAEAAALVADLGRSQVVNLYGDGGVGKTYVVRSVAHEAPELRDGIAFLFVRGKPLEDVLQALFEEFYECEPPYKAAEREIRADLAGSAAFVVLDGPELERDELQALVSAAPGSRFLVASRPRRAWDGPALRLRGLQTPDAVALVSAELRRALGKSERAAAERLAEALEGHPLRIRQAVAAAEEQALSLGELVQELEARGAAGLGELTVERLSPRRRRLLQALAAVEGADVGSELLVRLAADEEAPSIARELERLHLVESHSPRFSLAGGAVAAGDDVRADVLGRAIAWAEEQQRDPERQLAEGGALLALLGWAVSGGRHPEAVRLGRAIDGAFALGRRFGSWRRTIELVLGAAVEAGDLAAEAWALHQRGTRAFALGDSAGAITDLGAARDLRLKIGDEAGAAASSRNLALASRPPWYLKLTSRTGLSALPVLVVAGVLLFAAGAASGVIPWRDGPGGPEENGTTAAPADPTTAEEENGTAPDPVPGPTQTDPEPTETDPEPDPNGGGTGTVPTRVPLRVLLSGPGTVTSRPPGLECGAQQCDGEFATGETVVLTAAEGNEARFEGWSGAGCLGTGECEIELTKDAEVTATFRPVLRVTAASTEDTFEGRRPEGTVTSSPAGIDCRTSARRLPRPTGPSACAATFSDSEVVLTATAEAGSQLDRWEGCDTVQRNTCRVLLTAPRSVTATFGWVLVE